MVLGAMKDKLLLCCGIVFLVVGLLWTSMFVPILIDYAVKDIFGHFMPFLVVLLFIVMGVWLCLFSVSLIWVSLSKIIR